MKGNLIIIDGIDLCGKGTLVRGMANHLYGSGMRVFDLTQYCKDHKELPELREVEGFDVVLSNEPTYAWTGLAIRKEIIQKSARAYSARFTAEAFSQDRGVLYNRIIIPMLEQGKTVINDRGLSTSISYQPIQKEALSVEEILSLEGNRIALENRPDLLIIGSCPAEVAMQRKVGRIEKDDKAIFENLEFLRKADERFRSDWFREIFENKGSKVVYDDMTRSPEIEVSEALEHYNRIVRQG